MAPTRVGTHFLGRAGLELTGQSGSHTLRLDLASAPGGQHLLLGPDGVSLRTLSPAPGDGQSSASAKGAGGGAIESGDPDGVVHVHAERSGRSSRRSLLAPAGMSASSRPRPGTPRVRRQRRRGVVKVGNADGESHFENTNLAYIGTDSGGGNIVADGVVVEAGRTPARRRRFVAEPR